MKLRYWVILPLLTLFLAWGTGTLDYVHNLQHQTQDSQNDSAPRPIHDDSNCAIHATLHTPLAAIHWVPLLVCLGVYVAFLSLLETQPVSIEAVYIRDSRGPPYFR